jgi:hypothetical protein
VSPVCDQFRSPLPLRLLRERRWRRHGRRFDRLHLGAEFTAIHFARRTFPGTEAAYALTAQSTEHGKPPFRAANAQTQLEVSIFGGRMIKIRCTAELCSGRPSVCTKLRRGFVKRPPINTAEGCTTYRAISMAQ